MAVFFHFIIHLINPSSWLLSCCSCLVLSRVVLFATPWTVADWAPLSMGFPRQEYWSRLPFSSPADLPNPGMEPGLADKLFTELSHQGSPYSWLLRTALEIRVRLAWADEFVLVFLFLFFLSICIHWDSPIINNSGSCFKAQCAPTACSPGMPRRLTVLVFRALQHTKLFLKTLTRRNN